jgi:hypothetical protein
VKSPKVDPIVEAERGALAATVAVETLAAELAKAEREASRVAALFLRDAGQVEANMKATMLADRARALHLEGQGKLDAARATLGAAQRVKLAEQHEVDKVELAKFQESLQPLHLQLVSLDSALDDVVIGYAKHLLAAQAMHDAASARAKELGVRLDVDRPTLDDVQHLAQHAARLAREAAGRDCLSDWLSPEAGAGDWRMNGATTSEIRERLEHERRNRQTEQEARLVAQGAQLAAAHLQSENEGA